MQERKKAICKLDEGSLVDAVKLEKWLVGRINNLTEHLKNQTNLKDHMRVSCNITGLNQALFMLRKIERETSNKTL